MYGNLNQRGKGDKNQGLDPTEYDQSYVNLSNDLNEGPHNIIRAVSRMHKNFSTMQKRRYFKDLVEYGLK